MRTTWALAAAGLRGRRKSSAAVLIAVVALATLGIVSGPLFVDQSARAVDRTASEARVADVVVSGAPGVLPELAGTSGVTAASEVQPIALARSGDGADAAEVVVVGLDDPDQPVGRPAGLEGRWVDPSADDEIVLDRSGARALGVEVGDTVTLVAGETPVAMEVVGTAVDLTDCFAPSCTPVRAFASTAVVADLAAASGRAPDAQLQLAVEDPDQAEAVATGLLRDYGDQVSTQTWLDTRGDLLAAEEVFGALLTAFGLFLLVASCVVLAGSLVARVAARRRELGLYKAIGAGPGQVTAGLLGEHLVLSSIGVLAGWVLGCLLAPSLAIGVVQVLDPGGVRFSVSGLLVSLVVVSALVALTTVVPAWRAGREPATEVVRDAPERTPGVLARAVGRIRLPALSLGLHGTVANPLRAGLGALALVLAVVGAVVASGFVRTVDAVAADPARAGDPWDVELVAPEGVSEAEVEAVLASEPGVDGWYTETDRRSSLDGGTFLSRAVGGETPAGFVVGGGRAPEGAGEAMAGWGFLQRFDVEVGDTITFEAGGRPIEVEIVGWYLDAEDSGEVLTYRLEDLAAVEPDVPPGSYQLLAAPGTGPGQLARSLDQAFGGDASLAVVEVGEDQTAVVRGVMWLLSAMVAAVALAFLVATLAAGARERARELGVLRALGLSARSVVSQGAIAAVPLAVLSVAVGVPVGVLLSQALLDAATGGAGIGPGFGVAPAGADLLVIGVAVVAVASVLGLVSCLAVGRRPVPELIRWE